MSLLRFDGRVVIVTGAGAGLGKSHALMFASHGAKVVVNDLGGGSRGEGKSSAAADAVVAEIKQAGGEAVANYDSVEDGAKIVETAMDTWGRIDVLVNNAGILRDASFQKMTQEDWDLIYRVHVLGSFRTTHAAWNVKGGMRDKGYGRVVFTSSAAGIYGNFGQANYSTAKLGLAGLSNTLAVEGKKKGINVNTIAPIAGSRLTETVLPPDLIAALKPEYVSALVVWLGHEECTDTGGLFEVGGGLFTRLRFERTRGKTFKLGRPISPEQVKNAWAKISDFGNVTHPTDITSSMQPILGNLGTKSGGGNELIDVDEALASDLPAASNSYDERDVALYALAVGAAENPTDSKDLSLVYEMSGEGFQALPTFAVVPAMRMIFEQAKAGIRGPGLNYGFERILHGEQYTELKRPLPPKGTLTHKLKIKDIFDKGKNAVVVTSITTTDENGEELAYNELTSVVRGAGGWGGERGPSGDSNAAPSRAPDATVTEKTRDNQALLYRLTGDINPLHADPTFAKAFGFPKPILHGLCTFGFAARAVLKTFAPGGDPRFFKSIKVRFAGSVFPGETLVTEMWKESPLRIVFRTKVKETDKVVLSNAAVELYEQIPQPKPKTKPTAATAAASSTAPAGPASLDIFNAISGYFAQNAGSVKKIGVVYAFKLLGPDSAWTLDTKTATCAPGETAKPDCTLELTDADFMAMCTGKADPQKLYFGGKLKISGNVMASQKLEFLKKLDPQLVVDSMNKRGAGGTASGAGGKPGLVPAPATPAAPAPKKSANAPAIFAALGKRLTANKSLGAELGRSVLQFVVGGSTWTVSAGGVKEGANPAANATLTIGDEPLTGLVQGTRDAKDLFMRGELRADGDVRFAQKLGMLKGLV